MLAQVLALFLTVQQLPFAVTASQLWVAYRQSEGVANKKYRDHRLTVTGRVFHVSATYDISLDGGPGQVNGVVAVPGAHQYEAASRLQIGQIATLECDGAGAIYGEPLLLNCKVIP